jgi:hypothetical protein
MPSISRRLENMVGPFHRSNPRNATSNNHKNNSNTIAGAAAAASRSWDDFSKNYNEDAEESCSRSTSSVTSSASSSETSHSHNSKRRVVFKTKVLAYPCPEREITMADRKQRWLTRADLEGIKEDIRSTTTIVFEQREFRAAIERLYDMVRRERKYLVVDVDYESDDEEDNLCSGMTDLDLARLLIDTDTRGLERMLFTRMDLSRGSPRPAARHAKHVLETQASTQHMPPAVRAMMIANQCKTQASSIWARTLGEADAEAVSMKFMLQF